MRLCVDYISLIVFLISAVECMGKDCFVLADEDFVLNLLTNSTLRDKYQEYTFSDHVKVCRYIYFLTLDYF
jgi:hypothetical protein